MNSAPNPKPMIATLTFLLTDAAPLVKSHSLAGTKPGPGQPGASLLPARGVCSETAIFYVARARAAIQDAIPRRVSASMAGRLISILASDEPITEVLMVAQNGRST